MLETGVEAASFSRNSPTSAVRCGDGPPAFEDQRTISVLCKKPAAENARGTEADDDGTMRGTLCSCRGENVGLLRISRQIGDLFPQERCLLFGRKLDGYGIDIEKLRLFTAVHGMSPDRTAKRLRRLQMQDLCCFAKQGFLPCPAFDADLCQLQHAAAFPAI
jgi:hypothetical protein